MNAWTWLFTPGNDRRKLRSGLGAGCAALVVDWEDAVDEHRKDEARAVTAAFFDEEGLGGGRTPPSGRVGVRINACASVPFAADLEAVALLRPDFVMISKVERPSDLEAPAMLGVPLVALLESAGAVERVSELAAAAGSLAHDGEAGRPTAAPLPSSRGRVERLGFGALDFCADIHARWRPSGAALAYARARMVLASRHAGLAAPLDGVFPALEDLDGLRDEARLAREMGFGGKMLVHPSQIGPIAQAFAPEAEEVARARRILEAYADARAQGNAVFRLEGSLIDSPTVEWAKQVLADDATRA